jgi:hypothetical protein
MEDIINEIIYRSLGKQEMTISDEERIRGISKEYRYNIEKTAIKRKLLPFVADFMVNHHIDEKYWNEYLNKFRYRNECALNEMLHILTVFGEAQVGNVYPIENFGALLESGKDIAMFASGDIDLYAQCENHKEIHDIMTSLGWVKKKGDDYLGYYYEKDSCPVDVNIMWNWQAKIIPMRSCFSKLSVEKAKYTWGGVLR